MPYLAGIVTGVFLTVLVVFLVDNGMWRLRSCVPPLPL
jgi:hypothetical protein